jgi:hypothetical protein
MNTFKNKIMKDFEQDLYRCLNLSLADFINVVGQRGDDPLVEFDQIFEEYGPTALRDHMDQCINSLSIIYQERTKAGKVTR